MNLVKKLSDRIFHVARDREIKNGRTTDVYFERTRKILEEKGLGNVKVVAEVTTSDLPNNWKWAVLGGIEEVAKLFEGRNVNLYSMPEGTIFYPKDSRNIRVPVMVIEGPYIEFCILETPMLGLICQATGVCTMAARIKKIAWNKLLIAFGIRRMHPALAPMLDRAAFIGGFDGVSSLIGAETIKEKPMGTMPHSLIIMFGSQKKAWKAFDEVIDPSVPRIALVDTYFDEKAETLMAVEALGGKLYGVRLDTPTSRRGDLGEIVREIRWELDLRGHKNVKIILSGGINDKNIKEYCDAGADGFGVGTALSNAPTVDFAMDIVEKEGKPVAKKGKLGGKKGVWRCMKCMRDLVLPHTEKNPVCPFCGGKMEELLKPLIVNGKIKSKLPSPKEIREYVLFQLGKIEI